jgi:hypothetical protein
VLLGAGKHHLRRIARQLEIPHLRSLITGIVPRVDYLTGAAGVTVSVNVAFRPSTQLIIICCACSLWRRQCLALKLMSTFRLGELG